MGRGVAGALARVRRIAPTAGAALLMLALACGGFLFELGRATPATQVAGHARHAPPAAARLTGAPGNAIEQLGADSALDLPSATTAPAAAPAALVDAPPLASRENFAFAPYWTLAQSPGFSLTGLSTLAYFAVGVNPNGTLEESGPGWQGFESQALADLISRAHGAGERVVLTINDFGQSSLDALTASPTAAGTLSAALVPLLESKSMDGINIDFEGAGSRDQAGLTRLVAAVSGALRAADPHWQITMDTYASSAGDRNGFYDVGALAQSVDAFFVMAYELNLAGASTAAAPLTSGMFSDLTTLAQYTAAVPASKVILGAPFFGIDWPTDNGTLAATPTGAATDVADAQAQGAGPRYWDPVTETAWTSYQVGTQWHEAYYEDAYGLYRVSQLAARYGVRGVGIWALGMESNGAQLVAALDGLAPPGGPGGTGPQATSPSPVVSAAAPAASAAPTTTTAPPGTTTTGGPAGPTNGPDNAGPTTTTTAAPTTTATFDGATVVLTPVPASQVTTLTSDGSVTDFSSSDPAYACLDGKTLAVFWDGVLTGKRVAEATTPTDCVTQDFELPPS